MASCKGDTSRARIEFPAVGVEVFAHEADIRRERRKFAVAETRVSRAAGELIASKVPDFSVANIYIGDQLAHRMMYAPDSLEFETTLSENDVADLVLKDAGKILRRGSITNTYNTVELKTIVDDILANKEDPHNVITDYEFVRPSDLDQQTIISGSLASLTGGQDSPFVGSFDIAEPFVDQIFETFAPPEEVQEFANVDFDRKVYSVVGSFYSLIDEHLGTDITEDSHTGFDFENTTPYAALSTALNEFELNWWVTNDGVLQIGFDATAGQIMGVVGGNDAIKLNKYAVTTDPERINAVYVEGPQRQVLNRSSGVGGGLESSTSLQMLAEAQDPTRPGSLQAIEVERNVESLKELEEIAIRQLIQSTLDGASGSVTINGLASEDKDGVARLDVGDILAIDDSVNVRCGRALITGEFVVRGVHHRLNEQRGWTANVRLAQLPDMSEVQSKSVYYDPETDKEYDSLEQYKEGSDSGPGSTFGLQP